MRDADSELGFANKLLNEMNRRRITNKLILCGVATVCLIGTGFVLYYSLDD